MSTEKRGSDPDRVMHDFWKRYVAQDFLGRRILLRQINLNADFDVNLLMKFPDKQSLDYYVISKIQSYFDDLIEYMHHEGQRKIK